MSNFSHFIEYRFPYSGEMKIVGRYIESTVSTALQNAKSREGIHGMAIEQIADYSQLQFAPRIVRNRAFRGKT